MVNRNRHLRRTWISGIAALLCLCALLASCRTAGSGATTDDVTPENSMSEPEEPETKKPHTTAVITKKPATKAPSTVDPITQPPETTVPETEPPAVTTYEELPDPEGDLSWIPDTYSERSWYYLRKHIKSFSNDTFVCRYDQLDATQMYELGQALMALPYYKEFTGEQTFRYLRIGECLMSIGIFTKYNDLGIYSVAAYGQTLDFSEYPGDQIFLLSFYRVAVINYDNRVVINSDGDVYVMSKNGVFANERSAYNGLHEKESDAYNRAFYVEDGQLRCHRYASKFYRKYPYRPGLEFDWDQYPQAVSFTPFVGYGELWCEYSDVTFDESGAPIYTVFKTEYIDEAFAVHYCLGEDAYQRYLTGDLSQSELETAKKQFQECCELSKRLDYTDKAK